MLLFGLSIQDLKTLGHLGEMSALNASENNAMTGSEAFAGREPGLKRAIKNERRRSSHCLSGKALKLKKKPAARSRMVNIVARRFAAFWVRANILFNRQSMRSPNV